MSPDENLLESLVKLDDPFALRPEKLGPPRKPRSKLLAGILLMSILAGHLTLLGISLVWSGSVPMPRIWPGATLPSRRKKPPARSLGG